MNGKSSNYIFLAKALALACVRNTYLEDLHAGTLPKTLTGDYSDVKVVTPSGEIAWKQLSRISDSEMKTLMREVVNKLHTFLLRQNDPKFIEALHRLAAPYVQSWDEPELLSDFIIRKPD